jgi:hypothetical protein
MRENSMDEQRIQELKLVKLPPRVALYLITGELKVRMYSEYHVEDEADAFDAFDFSKLILGLTGFQIRSDEIYEKYNQLLQKRVDELSKDHSEEAFVRAAFDFYVDLEMEKRNRIEDQR